MDDASFPSVAVLGEMRMPEGSAEVSFPSSYGIGGSKGSRLLPLGLLGSSRCCSSQAL